MREGVALVSIFGAVCCALAQTAETRPAFDVTSVKPRAGGAQYLAFRGEPGGVHLEGPLHFFIRFAYGVQDYQLEGGPGWINSENYVVEAKTAGSHSGEEIKSMLQAMLEDRFALKMHRETRKGSVYSLVVAGKGSKMKRWVEGSCVDASPGKPLDTGATPCEYRPGPGTLESKGVSAAVLADFPLVDYGPSRCRQHRTDGKVRFSPRVQDRSGYGRISGCRRFKRRR